MRFQTNSLIFKVSILYIFITAINVTVFNIIVWENQTELILENTLLESTRIGNEITTILHQNVPDTNTLSPKTITTITELFKQQKIEGFTIYSEDGKRIFPQGATHSQDSLVTIQKQINKSITELSFQNRLFTHTLDQKERTIDLYIPFLYNMTQYAVVHVPYYMTKIDTMMSQLYRQCIIITIIIVIVHALFAIIVLQLVVKPLQKMIKATHEVSNGNFAVHIPHFGVDELGQLASSFNEMGMAISRMQDEAKGANPLTGLPGNISISQRIDYHIRNNHLFATLYCDLDNFKAYNDKYGFSKGDEAILHCRDSLIEASKKEGVHDVFIGHEGGDDFVVVAPIDCWETYVLHFITLFDAGVPQFYNEHDAKNRYIESVNRQGEPQRFPLMSISVAVVTNKDRQFTHHAEIVQLAAEIKKFVKKQDGSGYYVDQRRN